MSLIIQGYIILPYTVLAKKTIASANINSVNKQSIFSIIIVNVFMYNRQSDSLLSIIKSKNPTFVLTMEVNWWWTNQMNVLEATYPYQITYPTATTYGMCLYSKLPLSDSKIYFLNHDSVPSFHSIVTLQDSAKFQLFTIHPVAPGATQTSR